VNGLLLGVLASILAILLHMLSLRRLGARWRLPSLVVLLLLCLGLLARFGPHIGPLTLEDGFAALVLAMSFGLCYALLLNGVIHDSPTLALVNAIQSHEPEGMPLDAFDAFVARHPFVKSRLDALIDARQLVVDGDSLVLTGGSSRLVQLGDAYRRLRGDHSTEAG
jgi:hypothetical protein